MRYTLFALCCLVGTLFDMTAQSIRAACKSIGFGVVPMWAAEMKGARDDGLLDIVEEEEVAHHSDATRDVLNRLARVRAHVPPLKPNERPPTN